jgi:hypothetical protein
MVLYAGALSEPLFKGAPTKEIGEAEQAEAVRVIKDPQSGAASDHAKIRELRTVLRNIRFVDTKPDDVDAVTKELEDLDNDLWGRTIKLVNRHYETICGLAINLASRMTREGEEVTIGAAELEKLGAVTAITPVRSDEFS